MIILIILAVLLILSLVTFQWMDDHNLEAVNFLVALFSGVILAFAIVAIPVGRMSDHDKVIEYCAIKQSIDEQRLGSIPMGSSAIERATIGVSLAQAKAEIDKINYWNKSWWVNKAWHIEDTSCPQS